MDEARRRRQPKTPCAERPAAPVYRAGRTENLEAEGRIGLRQRLRSVGHCDREHLARQIAPDAIDQEGEREARGDEVGRGVGGRGEAEGVARIVIGVDRASVGVRH